MLFSCDYQGKEAAIARQKAIEEQEAKRQDMKNNIAKYVYFKNGRLINDTDYTIDEITYEYYAHSVGKKTEKKTYIPAHSEISCYNFILDHSPKILSIKIQALGIN